MGLKNFLDKLKKKAEGHLQEETDPAKIRAAKKEANEKKMKRTASLIKGAQKGMEVYNNVAKKVEEITDGVAEKTAELAEKAKPAAEKVDKAAGVVGDKASKAFKSAKDAIVDGASAAGGKIEEIREENAKKPSTGSGLLDILAPAIPETEATKPKKSPEPPKATPPAP